VFHFYVKPASSFKWGQCDVVMKHVCPGCDNVQFLCVFYKKKEKNLPLVGFLFAMVMEQCSRTEGFWILQCFFLLTLLDCRQCVQHQEVGKLIVPFDFLSLAPYILFLGDFVIC